jgi:alpha-beta hydrolase superfamily lysophospholipase
MTGMFKDELFQAQWLRAAGYAGYGGAELGECLAVAGQIREGDAESWFAAWSDFAQRLEAIAAQSLAAGRRESARGAWLRASNYWRTAYTFLIGVPLDARVTCAYRRQRSAFEAAAALMTPKVERIAIPYEGASLHGWLLRPPRAAGPWPMLIFNGGYDSTAEEGFFLSGAAALARGYACILFDGPGQGAAIVEDGVVFRPDWETVVGPVVDFALTLPGVDAERIALMGASFGGYLAPRAASGEPRLAALVADPGMFSLADELKSRMPDFVADRLASRAPWIEAPLRAILDRRRRHLTGGWALRRGTWVHGVANPLDYLRLAGEYSLEGRADRIACPSLICRAEADDLGTTAHDLYDRLTAPRTFHTFASRDGAGEHCEAGARAAFNQVAFDWLDAVLDRNMD